ncbi:hypothetical protein TSAR_012756 [Trichomalopsis sarcophagae]|uniref:EamA domain-containing protein n=1 Tax=Trichomalopsis sarcophagae TaxID=543379 RepID=A0A232EZU8_9HYME|nr:hypothetical protein TSAR_012756 [Trichomalopsis sarcophagae]
MATTKTESTMHLAVVSGLFATSGGILGKLAGFYDMSDFWSLMAKVILLLAMVTSNTIGCTLFVKALAGSGSSLPATVASSTVNYFCSALVGQLVFGESTSLRWWCGTSIVLLGLLLICYSPVSSEQRRQKEERKRQ